MQFKKLAIISDCIHVRTPEGNVGTDNPVFLRQMQALASEFEETWICCPIIQSHEYKSVSFYSNNSIHFLPIPKRGGTSIRSKLEILKTLPVWFKVFKKIDHWADVVYQRFPNNINIPGFFYFYLKHKKVFATYTGNWFNYKGEPITYRFQKVLLKKMFRGPAGIYFEDREYPHIFKTFSPSYTLHEWQIEIPFVEAKQQRWQNDIKPIPVFITVGLLTPMKNQQFILDCFLILKNKGFNFELYIVGDGILKENYEQFVHDNDLSNYVFITGKKNYDELKLLYRKADFLVHASLSEGFVKVPVEGFFHGVIPILNNFSIAGEMVGNNERGFIFSVNEKEQFIQLVSEIMKDTKSLQSKIEKGRQYAYERTMELWKEQFMRKVKTYLYKEF